VTLSLDLSIKHIPNTINLPFEVYLYWGINGSVTLSLDLSITDKGPMTPKGIHK